MDQTYVNLKYKNNLFCDLFSEKEYALSLYNALNHSAYTNIENLEIVTLSEAIFLKLYLLKKKAEVKLMLLTEFDQEAYERVIREEEREEEKHRINQLISILIDQNRIDDLKRSAKDPEYQEKLILELLPGQMQAGE